MSVQVDIITQTIEVQIVEDEVVNVSILDGVSVLTDGTLAGVARAIEFLSGSNVSISAEKVDNKVRVTINSTASGGGNGDVTGPASSTDGEIVLYDGLTGKIIKNSSNVLTTVGGNILSLTNPGAITFLRINADNTVTARSATDFLTDIGAVPTSRTVNGQALSSNIEIPTITSYVRSGTYLLNSITSLQLTVVSLGAGELRAFPFVVSKSITFTEIIAEVTTAIGATTFRVGIYTSSNGYPDALVSGTDVGTYDSTTNAVKSSGAVNIVLSPQLYWIVWTSNGSIGMRAIPQNSIPQVFGASTIGTNSNNVRWLVARAYQALPTTFPSGAAAAPNVAAPAIGLLIS